jgi:hypothetical protein
VAPGAWCRERVGSGRLESERGAAGVGLQSASTVGVGVTTPAVRSWQGRGDWPGAVSSWLSLVAVAHGREERGGERKALGPGGARCERER